MSTGKFAVDGSLYIWSQTGDQISVLLTVSNTFKSKDAKISFKEKELSVSIAGEKSPRISGFLYGDVIPTECIWEVESSSTTDSKILTIHLEKQPALPWPVLIGSGEKGETDIDCQSLYELGNYHQLLDEVPKAVNLITLAAERGCISAMLKLAAWYEIGSASDNDYPLARDQAASHFWHLKAAELGNAEACYVVASTYFHGSHNVTKDYSKASSYFLQCFDTKSLENDLLNVYISAAFQLGLIFMTGGHGIGNPEPSVALEHWKKSAVKGHPDSIYNVGVFTLNGFGTDIDIPLGVEMIKISMKGNPALQLPPPLDGISEGELETFVGLCKSEDFSEDTSKEFMERVVGIVKEMRESDARTDFEATSKVSTAPSKKKKKKKFVGRDGKQAGLERRISFPYLESAGILSLAVTIGLIYYFNKK